MISIQEYITKLQKRIDDLQAVEEEARYIAVQTIHADQVERIFSLGMASDGSKIGNYNTTKSIYVNPKDAPKGFTPEGKTGKKEHINGAQYKTKYFSSYAAFRANQGRKTDAVNLDLFGRLKSEYENGLRRGDEGAWISGLRTDESIDKAVGNQYRFNKGIFALTESEKEKYFNILFNEINSRLNA